MAIAGMILGIIAVIFGLMTLLIIPMIISIPCILVGLPLSAVAFGRAKREGESIGIAVTGIVLNTVAILLVVVFFAIGVLFIAG